MNADEGTTAEAGGMAATELGLLDSLYEAARAIAAERAAKL